MNYDKVELPPLLNQKQAAAHLGVSVRTLLNWANAGRGPQPTRVGGRTIVYDRAALDLFALGAVS